MRIRHTMGNDWGGRSAANPAGSPRVTAAQVHEAAKAAGVDVRREGSGWSMWWARKPGENWLTLATTNFLALQALAALSPEAE